MLWLWLVRLLNSHSIEGGGTQPLVSSEGTCLVLSSVLFSCVIVSSSASFYSCGRGLHLR